jgi:hypothetical protein
MGDSGQGSAVDKCIILINEKLFLKIKKDFFFIINI